MCCRDTGDGDDKDGDDALRDAMAAIVEDIAGNADGTPATVDQLNLIPGVSRACCGNDYSTALAAGSFAKPGEPTAEEIQRVIDDANDGE